MTDLKTLPTFAPFIPVSIETDGTIRTRLDDGNRRDLRGKVVVGKPKTRT